ncbi:hypothetical protein Asppvi_010217 [Aspergillus pseudoviridinutans]|uniref:Uncharacterized protein n=1 Tax=Aspergillus pseudoviridinutans TaxID=1517512 RepID=A0A9P3EZ80_9EURO|nr:uncharacterized protein Asppvi_010217 [Aspergillus pseudoviridinutans]GIJ91252.1 hypothetical protein Asppvi_010217 [Aspergillus pseudoviridinutans]
MCGLDAAPRVFLVTTMWDSLGTEHCEGLLRESRLVSTREFWGRFCRYGSQTNRWRGDESSALSIIDALITLSDRKGYKTLLIQREIVDEKKSLKETTAGQELMAEYVTGENKLLDELRSLQSEAQDCPSEIKSCFSELRREIENMRRAQKELGVSIQGLFNERENAYGEVLSKTRDNQQNLAAELKEERRKYQRLQDEMKSNEELLEEERYHWEIKRAKLDQEARTGRRRRESIDMEYQHIDEEELLLNEQLDEFQHANEEDMSKTSESVLRLRKREVVKRNILPFLGVLAGVGLTVAGAVTGLIPLAGAGVGFTVSSASGMNLSRKIRGEGPYENGSLAANSFTAAFHGASVSDLILGNN